MEWLFICSPVFSCTPPYWNSQKSFSALLVWTGSCLFLDFVYGTTQVNFVLRDKAWVKPESSPNFGWFWLIIINSSPTETGNCVGNGLKQICSFSSMFRKMPNLFGFSYIFFFHYIYSDIKWGKRKQSPVCLKVFLGFACMWVHCTPDIFLDYVLWVSCGL